MKKEVEKNKSIMEQAREFATLQQTKRDDGQNIKGDWYSDYDSKFKELREEEEKKNEKLVGKLINSLEIEKILNKEIEQLEQSSDDIQNKIGELNKYDIQVLQIIESKIALIEKIKNKI